MNEITAFAYDTYWLGLRTTRRFIRVPANLISIIFFPLIQLLVFSQLFKDIVQLPAFATDSYLAYLAPGQVVFASFLAVGWAGYGMLVEYRTGYLDKLRATPIARSAILAGEMVPLFFEAAFIAGVILGVSVLLGATLVTGLGGLLLILFLSGVFGLAFAGLNFIAALLTKSEQAVSALSLLMFPVVFISTAFVPTELMPGWMQSFNDWNPVTYQIEAIRALMTEGYDWSAIGSALLADAIVGRRPAGGHALGVPEAGEVSVPAGAGGSGPGRRLAGSGPAAAERAGRAAGDDAAGGTIRTDDRSAPASRPPRRPPRDPQAHPQRARRLPLSRRRGRGALRGQGEGAAQARRQLPAPGGDAARAHRRDARAGRATSTGS